MHNQRMIQRALRKAQRIHENAKLFEVRPAHGKPELLIGDGEAWQGVRAKDAGYTRGESHRRALAIAAARVAIRRGAGTK